MSQTSKTPETPKTVEPGQVWRDNDQRTKGSGEFTVIEATYSYALVRRHDTGLTTRILVERLLRETGT